MPSLTPGNTPQQRNAKGPGGWGGRSKALSFWALVILVPLIFLRLSGGGREQTPEIDYSVYSQQLSQDSDRSTFHQWRQAAPTIRFRVGRSAE